MEELLRLTGRHFAFLETKIDENNKQFEEAESRLDAALLRAKQLMVKKSVVNPKPSKRPAPMKIMEESEEADEDEESAENAVILEVTNSDRPVEGILRPTRTAKAKANANLREPPSNSKLRNDNNVATYVKSERSSTSERRDSTKENSEPRALKKTSTIKSDRSKRSESVEIIGASKIVEIDMTKDDDVDKMPPPSMPIAKTKSKRINKSKQTKDDKSDGENSIILPQSEIKKEKVSIETTITNQTQIISESGSSTFSATMIQQSTICETTTVKGKKGKKKYPMPMLVKMEPDEVPKIAEVAKSSSASNEHLINETFDVQKAQPNQTVTLASGAMNETVTLETNVEKKSSDRNLHDSLMTEDNDDEDAEEENAASATFAIPEIRDEPPPLPPKKKHNEVFNPYIASPVKQKIQAFEKRANQVATPEKYKTMPSKFMTLKAGTPSKIALFSGKTTPVSSTMTRAQKFASCSTLPSSLVKKTSKSTTKKAGSISQDTLDAESKKPTGQVIALSHQQLLEEKKKAREEKQRLAQLQREAIEKEKREVALRLQLEREEKHRKALREKEERLRIEAHKKKLKKEQQTVKKFIEKERQEDEAKAARDNDVHLNATAQMNDSLLVKLQKQKVEAHKQKMKNEENKNTYSFDMLQTDDSTDDEAQPSAKRPPPPSWSKKSNRKEVIRMQNHVNTKVLDALFSVQPLDIDLREIFPAIDSRKLARNSSAVWRTPPPHRYDYE